MKATTYITIHGHFYQPPRENPWTEHIERQESAAPFHDWNERINKECYHANGFAEILNSEGKIEDIINNYQHISFNIGPTLMNWIKEKSPGTYHAIVEADRKSQAIYDGHGNAIAQVYNHTILPLATQEDKFLQILWGIEDFTSHFGRAPESIWLAETAVNQDTIDVLVEFGLKYIILSPFQAERVRPMSGKSWKDVSSGSIDTSVPYRQFSRDGRFIDIFFYNHAISSAIGFEHLLTNSYRLAEKFRQFVWNPGRPILIAACTDGESYGHHEKFGEMCLAHFIKYTAPECGLKLTNFGQFLALNPPTHEVQIKPGPNGEGTAWSCAHGVGRWVRNCGCSDGGYPSWGQEWRTPLRGAFNWLHETILEKFEKKVAPLLNRPREARRRYIDVLKNRSAESRGKFLSEYGISDQFSDDDQALLFRFMEALAQCQLMFTSCAWFFADVARLEPVQTMKYAARAIQLVERYFKTDLEGRFIEKLAAARSNVPAEGNGRDIYINKVIPSRISYKMVVSNFAIESFVLNRFEHRQIYQYTIKAMHQEIGQKRKEPVQKGMVWLLDNYTGQKLGYIYFLFMESLRDVRCYILNNKESIEFNITTVDVTEKKLQGLTRGRFYTLRDLFIENREQIIQLAFAEQMKQIQSTLDAFYEKKLYLMETFHEVGLPRPKILKHISEFIYINRIENYLSNTNGSVDLLQGEEIVAAFQNAVRLNFDLNSDKIRQKLNQVVHHLFSSLKKNPQNKSASQNIIKILDLADKLAMPLDFRRFTETAFALLHQSYPNGEIPTPVVDVARRLKLAVNIQTAAAVRSI